MSFKFNFDLSTTDAFWDAGVHSEFVVASVSHIRSIVTLLRRQLVFTDLIKNCLRLPTAITMSAPTGSLPVPISVELSAASIEKVQLLFDIDSKMYIGTLSFKRYWPMILFV